MLLLWCVTLYLFLQVKPTPVVPGRDTPAASGGASAAGAAGNADAGGAAPASAAAVAAQPAGTAGKAVQAGAHWYQGTDQHSLGSCEEQLGCFVLTLPAG